MTFWKTSFCAGFAAVASVVASGCSSSSKDPVTTVPSSVQSSCNYVEAKQCFDYHTAASAQSNESLCADAKGLWAASACAAENKVSGCLVTVAGIKTLTFWTYDSVNGANTIAAYCVPGNPTVPAGAALSIVTP